MTFGRGVRGFNVYVGTVNLAEFERMTTSDGPLTLEIVRHELLDEEVDEAAHLGRQVAPRGGTEC